MTVGMADTPLEKYSTVPQCRFEGIDEFQSGLPRFSDLGVTKYAYKMIYLERWSDFLYPGIARVHRSNLQNVKCSRGYEYINPV